MTDDELKELVAKLATAQRETDKQLKELGKQIGGLGKKFGRFTEGLALPSTTKILRQRFKMEVISSSVRNWSPKHVLDSKQNRLCCKIQAVFICPLIENNFIFKTFGRLIFCKNAHSKNAQQTSIYSKQ